MKVGCWWCCVVDFMDFGDDVTINGKWLGNIKKTMWRYLKENGVIWYIVDNDMIHGTGR